MTRRLGFTLLEMALVLTVMSVLVAGMVTPLVSAREHMNRTVVGQRLQQIESALMGHLLTQNRLPCAATANSAGRELASADGCSQYAGYLPSATLGLSGPTNADGLLIDPWGRPFRYRVSASDSDLDHRADYVVADGLRLQAPLTVRADNRIALAVDEACGTVAARADAVVAVVVSEGNQPARSAGERENTDGDAAFVSRPASDAPGCVFDDQLLWLTENRVLTLLLQAGALPRSDGS